MRNRLAMPWLPVFVSGTLLACYLPSMTAQSQERAVPLGFYGGAGVGLSSLSVEVDDEYYYFPGYEQGEEDGVVGLHFGYRLSKHVAAEFGYFETGPEWDDTFVYIPELNDYYNVFVDTEVQATQFTVLGAFPFARIWEAYVKGGVAYWQGDADQTLIRSIGGQVLVRSVEDSSTDFLFGFGVGATPTPGWHVRVEFQSFGIDRNLIAAEDSTTIDSMLFEVAFQPGAKSKPSDAVAALTERFERRIGAH